MDLMEIMRSPLTMAGPGPFLRLVLAEAARYGMPPQVLATLDDVAAMLGYYEPLPPNQAAHLGGPMTFWRTDRRQPVIERVAELESLALKQRALVAFGGAPPGHQIGTAEIVCAMGNLHKDHMPPDYYDLFSWASVTAFATLTQRNAADIRKERGWPLIEDAEVVNPGGRLHAVYLEVATYIRRTAISGFAKDRRNPRLNLRPLGAHFLISHQKVQASAARDGRSDLVQQMQETIDTIRAMFPDIDQEVAQLNAFKAQEAQSPLTTD